MVEPPKPDMMKRMRAVATQEEVEEYERLLSERFATDPSVATRALAVDGEKQRESRIRELHLKIFGKSEER